MQPAWQKQLAGAEGIAILAKKDGGPVDDEKHD